MALTRPFAVIVLAAGGGTRMKSARPKVLHEVAGRSLVGHVLTACRPMQPEHLVVTIGHGRERVAAHLDAVAPDAVVAVQHEQRGTGHAVRVTLEQMAEQGIVPGEGSGPILVLTGDTPLLTDATLQHLLRTNEETDSAATVLTAILEDATGYGRVVRDAAGDVTAIVEHKDADETVRAIREVNSGMYAFGAAVLERYLHQLTTDNAQGEEYLTDVIGHARADGLRVTAVPADDPREILGVNDRAQLAQTGAILRERINGHWLRAGVTMVDPSRVYIDSDVELAPDVLLEPGVALRGTTTVARGATIGPDTTLTDTEVGAGAHIRRTEATLAITYLRPGTKLAARAKVGGFCEVKNATVGEGSKVPHLSYVGDAEIGAGSNIGAATVFVNYDGVAKHRTIVGDNVRVGSDTMLVAPLVLGDGSYTAAGSVVTEDVPAGALAVGRGRQRNVEGWVERRRPDTASAESARVAREREGA
jgi:bifunctional UDP-N-acetylglucosamine pyrophosphorylase/glucosamine-1-phosphate N-acetyltransferase